MASTPLSNPYLRIPSRSQPPSTQAYIRLWVDRVLQGLTIVAESRSDIRRRLGFNQSYSISTTSSIATLIYDRVRESCLRHRQFLELAADGLQRQSRQLCLLRGRSSAWRQFGSEGSGQQGVYMAWGEVYVLAYRYLCQSARELYHLWSALSDCAETKDRTGGEFRKGLSSLILEIFAEGKHMQPGLVLPTLPFAVKCQFIYADAGGIERRELLARFNEDHNVRKGEEGCECGSVNCQGGGEVGVNPTYIGKTQTDPSSIPTPLPMVTPSQTLPPIAPQPLDDSSDSGPQYDFGMDDLLECGQEFQLQVSHTVEKHSFNRQTEGSSKLSSSSGCDDQLEKTEPLREIEFRLEGEDVLAESEEGQFQPQEAEGEGNSSSCWGDASGSDHEIDLTEEQLGSEPIFAKIEQLRRNMGYLYPEYPLSSFRQAEWNKFQKNRKVLEEERRKLLRDIESYAGERERELERGRAVHLQGKERGKEKEKREKEKGRKRCLPYDGEIDKRMNSTTERVVCVVRQCEKTEEQREGLSRRQQKLKRKQERALQSKKAETKAQKPYLCEQETALSSFLQTLQIDNLTRVSCRVSEHHTNRWSSRITSLRTPNPTPPTPPNPK